MSASDPSTGYAAGPDAPVRRVVVVGGGTAGWLAACLIAARTNADVRDPVAVTLIESPDVPTVGVGEGTWPTMRGTLEKIGLSESAFLDECDAAFKQGTRFEGWRRGAVGERYYHPFTTPFGKDRDAVGVWANSRASTPFADVAGPQPAICERDLAPRQRQMPGYAGALNYAYHLDAGKFARLLARHGAERLGVKHVRDHVSRVIRGHGALIAGLETRATGRIEGDLFVDCTGSSALLIGGHYGVPVEDCSDVLLNDRALAIQVPQATGAPLASQTNATAHEAGWIWDIGLPTRRGVGCVYSERHMNDGRAEEVLRSYLDHAPGADLADRGEPRLISFRSGYRAEPWQGNCLALGQAAGFLEPLEASAIVMVELGTEALLEDFPRTPSALAPRARRFNALMRYRWKRIVEFLKLHYLLSRRDEPYWRDHRDPGTVPARLAELLELWRERPPLAADFSALDEVFPSASWQYVLYGMGFPAPPLSPIKYTCSAELQRLVAQRDQRTRSLLASLPSNRAYFEAMEASATTQKATVNQ